MRIEEPAALGLLLVEAQAPEIASQLAVRQRRAFGQQRTPPKSSAKESYASAAEQAEAITPVLLAEMFDAIPPNWERRHEYYESRHRIAGLRDDPTAYAAAEAKLGRRLDCRA